MKKLLLISTSLLSTAVMAAMPVNQPVGSSFTLSNAPNQRALATSLGNPAAPFIMVNQQDNDNFRFGIVGPIGVGVEFGDISDLGDRVEKVQDLVDELDATDINEIRNEIINNIDTSSITAELNAATTQEELEKIIDDNAGTIATAVTTAIENKIDEIVKDANSILDGVSESAYVKTMISAQVPFMPVIYKTDSKGAFTIDSSISAVIKGNLTEGEIKRDELEFSSDLSFYSQVVTDFNIGFGYSQSMWENSHGMLIGGAKANVHQLSSGRALVALTDENADVGDAVSDSLEADAVAETTGVGIDLGAVWVSNYYQAGITIANINEPEFDRATIDSSCSSESCSAAKSLSNSGEISLTDTYTMEMQTTLDFAVSTPGKQVTLGLSYDINPVEDAVGDEYQWAVASLSYYGDSHFLPGLRGGLRQNMAGSELSYATAGLTLLKRLNLDVAVALETVENEDGDSAPRSVYFSLGYDTAF
jgi:hypothetical protein